MPNNVCKECKDAYPWSTRCPHGGSTDVAVRIEDGRRDVQLVEEQKNEIAIRQTQALEVIGNSLATLVNYIGNGGLAATLSGYARSQSVKEILGGLAAHDGRNALDARTIKQNALEITEAIEAVFAKYQDRLSEKGRDPEIKEPKE